jgi:hypothetical protein
MTREAQLVEKINATLTAQAQRRSIKHDDSVLIERRGNMTVDAVHLETLPNYRDHYVLDEDKPNARGHIPVYAMRYVRSHPDAQAISSLRWPRFNADRVFEKRGWRKIERSYVRALQLTHRAWNHLSSVTLVAIESCRLTVYRKVYVPLGRQDNNLELVFSSDGKLESFTVVNDLALDYANPSVSVIHDEQSRINIILAFRHYKLSQRRCDLMQHVLMRWAFPKYHAKEDVEMIDASGNPVTVIMVPRSDDCPFDRAYVMEGNSFNVKFPVFWPHGTLNVIE